MSIPFKEELVTNTHWIPYGLVLIVLFAVLMILAKYSKKKIKSNSTFKVIERMAIHHKTKAFVIDYQGQQFLLTDNQNSLAIHPLKKVNTDAE